MVPGAGAPVFGLRVEDVVAEGAEFGPEGLRVGGPEECVDEDGDGESESCACETGEDDLGDWEADGWVEEEV